MHYGSDDTTFLYLITHRINSNIDQFAHIFASAFTTSVLFFSFLFMKIGQVTPRILSKLGVHYGSDKVLPPFKNPHFYYLKLFISEAFHYFQIKVMAQKNSDYFESYGIIFMPDRQ